MKFHLTPIKFSGIIRGENSGDLHNWWQHNLRQLHYSDNLAKRKTITRKCTVSHSDTQHHPPSTTSCLSDGFDDALGEGPYFFFQKKSQVLGNFGNIND